MLRTRRFWIMASIALRTAPIDAITALYWILSGKRVRGWSHLVAVAARNPIKYEIWIRLTEPLAFADFLAAYPPREQREAAYSDVACLILCADETEEAAIARTAESVRIAFGYEVCIWANVGKTAECAGFERVDERSLTETLELLLAKTGCRWFLPLWAGDIVSERLGDCFSAAVGNLPGRKVIYWDEDLLAEAERREPWIKPDWDELLFLARDLLSGAAAFEAGAALRASQRVTPTDCIADQVAAFAIELAATSHNADFQHVPLVLTHRARSAGIVSPTRRTALIERHWREDVFASPSADAPEFLSLRFPDPQKWPMVSILIPTRDRPELLKACMEGLVRLRYGGEIEIILIDNGSTEVAALDLLRRCQAESHALVIRHEGPFNFSELNNRAARRARGEFLCLLNNDIEALDGDWLTVMMRHAVRPDSGATGALLLYPDLTVQHAGVTIGMGDAAGHIQRGVPDRDTVNFPWHGVTRHVSAVTAACMIISKSRYFEVGGLDESTFAVAFNDVDLCLKLGKAGLRNVYVAEARLIHHESKSRGSDYSKHNIARFRLELAALQKKWATPVFADPYFSPRFARAAERCQLEI